MVVLDKRSRLFDQAHVGQASFIRSEISDGILISAVIAIALVDLWRYTLITAGWLQRRLERHEAKRLDEARAEAHEEGREEGRVEGVAEGVEKVLSVLDDEARKDAERKLNLNGNSDSKD